MNVRFGYRINHMLMSGRIKGMTLEQYARVPFILILRITQLTSCFSPSIWRQSIGVLHSIGGFLRVDTLRQLAVSKPKMLLLIGMKPFSYIHLRSF